MKRVNNLFEKIISDSNIEFAIDEVNKSHRYCRHHKPNKVVQEIENNKPYYIQEIKKVIINGFVPSPCRTIKRYDKSACKLREISEPKLYPDQYVHHALIQVLQPVMMRGMDKWCCGSIKGRGIHYGVKALKRWMRTDRKGTKYCAELDIHHFYQSIKPQEVVNRFKNIVKDNKAIDLLKRVVSPGIQIGSYTSQWFANVLLQPLDNLIRQGGFGVSHYIRYMDNFTIFSPNKRKLAKLVKVVSQWLQEHSLELKANWQYFNAYSRKPCALGYRYGHGYTMLRKRNKLRLMRQLRKFYKKRKCEQEVSSRFASGLISRLAQMKHCRHFMFYKNYVKPNTLKKLKSIVREWLKIKEIELCSTLLAPLKLAIS